MSDLLTVSEAATLAGVSARTMRRWVNAGQVRTVGHGHGRRVLSASLSEPAVTNGQNGHVRVTADRTGSATADTETDSGHEADRLADLVRELTVRLSEQTGLTAMWQERAGTLADRLTAAESQLLALAAPPESPLVARTAPKPVEPTQEPWWRPLARAWIAGLSTLLALAVILLALLVG
jgi:excisionase family DNA binding protein